MSEAAPAGFRRLRLIDIKPENEAIASFRFELAEPGGWTPYRPGQFLVFRVPDAGAPGGWALRNYSISGPSDGRTYRVCVKREPHEGSEHGAGLGSGHFHHRLRPGDEVWASAPRGEFVLDEASQRAVLLLSGGVGLTPLVAMLHRLVETSDRPVFFIHAAENGRQHALAEEVEALAARRPGIRTAFVYRAPDEADAARGRHVASGLVTREVLQSILPLDDYDTYLCGPTGFMRAQYDALTSLGLRPERIAYEFFGPASLLGAPEVVVAPAAMPEPSPALPGEGPLISFAASGASAVWSESAGSLLDLAEGAGLSPPFSCRAGVCMSCSTKILSGEVEYFEEPLDEPPPGEVLLCCTRPRGSVTLDI